MTSPTDKWSSGVTGSNILLHVKSENKEHKTVNRPLVIYVQYKNIGTCKKDKDAVNTYILLVLSKLLFFRQTQHIQ